MKLARRLLGLCVFVALLVAGWYFAARNSAAVTVHHPGGVVGEMKLWVALALAFGLGALSMSLVMLVPFTRLRLVARRYRKVIGRLEREIHQLRNLPLAVDSAGPSERGAPLPEAASERGP